VADFPEARPDADLRVPELRVPLRRRSIYLLPNLVTTAALFAGFYAVVQAMNARFDQAAVAIFVAMVLDGLDGRIARMTRTQSEFGADYDSLSDMVSFGAAPALVMYVWALKDLGNIGWIPAFVYCAAAAVRLARFNTNIEVVDKRFFQGLPSPAAAALVAGFIWVADDFGIDRVDWIRYIAFATTLFAGITMVVSIPFYSFKDFNLRKRVPFWVVPLIIGAITVIAASPPMILFLMFVAYSMSGYVMWILKKAGQRKTALKRG
jgi:CDP-diacylglycerol--serine O-phosphatidyltransferase